MSTKDNQERTEKLRDAIAEVVYKGTGADNGERAWTADAILALPEMVALLNLRRAGQAWLHQYLAVNPKGLDGAERALADAVAAVTP